jgi:MFS family permease
MDDSQVSMQDDKSVMPSYAPNLKPDQFLHETTADDPISNLQSNPDHQRTLATTLFLLTTSLLFADQNLLSPNLSSIAAEFNLSPLERDTKLGGHIAIAFFMIGVPASFLVGCLADVVERRSLLFLCVIVLGEGACMATYWVSSYNQLYWCRALTGFSIGGALPLIYSVLGDYWGRQERGWVSGAVSMGCGIGISFGQGVAGFIGPRYGWR